MSGFESPGEGGGVCSKAPRRLLGREEVLSVGEITDAPGDDIGEIGVLSPCDRLIRFEGCGTASVVGVDFRGER